MGCVLSVLATSLLDPDSFPKLLLHLFSKNGRGEKKEVKGETQGPVFSFLSALGAKCQFLSGTWPLTMRQAHAFGSLCCCCYTGKFIVLTTWKAPAACNAVLKSKRD